MSTSKDKPPEPVTVLRTADPGLVAVAKSILQDAGIPYHAKGEGIQNLFGLGSIGFNPISGPVELQVPASRADEAADLLADLEAAGMADEAQSGTIEGADEPPPDGR